MRSLFGSDTILEFEIGYEGVSFILLYSPTYPVRPGQSFRMTIEVDESFRQNVSATVFDNSFVALELGAYQDVITTFRKGSALHVSADNWTDGFQLTGTDKALRRLEICYQTYAEWRSRLYGSIAGTS